jgi:Tol biopolymer transport system component
LVYVRPRRFLILLTLVAVALIVWAGAAMAAGTITRASESASGEGATSTANWAVVSDDGRFVAFKSAAANLVPGDTNGNVDVFVKDMQTGAIERVSVSSDGSQANDNSAFNGLDMSADGNIVVFDSIATNLVDGDTNTARDVFIHARAAGTTVRILRPDGTQNAGQIGTPSISADGRYVAVVATGLDEDAELSNEVFVYDRVADTLEHITGPADEFRGSSNESPVLSDHGRWLAFTTRAFNSQEDIVLYDRQTDAWEIANPRYDGTAPSRRHHRLSISDDGRYVAFRSPDSNLVPGDDPDTWDAFVYDSQTDTLERIPADGTGITEDPEPVISGNGRYVTFVAGAADPHGAANGVKDVVVYDRTGDSYEVVSLYEDGSPATRQSLRPHLSADGRYVVFETREPFDEDGDTGFDVYIVDREGTSGTPDTECTSNFTDVDPSNIFEDDICWLADQGITRGCNPPANTEFCPTDPVTRGQMAAFLVRALGYDDNGGGDLFTDDDGTVFEGDIDRLGTAGVTRGCNPPANTEFCPNENVTRQQMAAFLRRALDN